MRLALTLTHDGYLGVDGGAYLLSVNAVLGDEPTGAGFPRPPMAPGWLLVPFVEVFGGEVGYKVWASIASLLPIIPVYLLTRRLGVTPSLFAAGFLSLDLLHAEMIVTGALPLIGFALLGIVWWAMGRLSQRWSWAHAGVLAGCLGLLPYINQTTAGLALVTIPVYFLALTWFNRQCLSPTMLPIIPPLLLGGIIGLGALPWYLGVLPVTGLLNYPGPFLYLTHPFDSAWWQLILAWPLGIWLVRKGGEPWLRALGVLICLLGTLLVFLSTDETVINVFYRSRYLLAIPFYVGVSWVVYTRWAPHFRSKALPAALTAGALLIMTAGYISQFHRQAGYSDMATPATTEALLILKEQGLSAGVVNNSFTLALWISALNKVPSPHTWTWAPPRHFTETDRAVRCILGWVPGCDVLAAKNQLHVEYVLIDTRFPAYNKRAPSIYMAPPDQWAVTAQAPWLTKIFERDSTLVWRIDS